MGTFARSGVCLLFGILVDLDVDCRPRCLCADASQVFGREEGEVSVLFP